MTIPNVEDTKGATYGNFVFFKKGGMGELYKGINLSNHDSVALKLVPVSSAEEEKLLGRELEVCGSLLHENIARTIHTGKMRIVDIDYLFVLQEYYPDGNLRPLIQEGTSIDVCVRMMLDITAGLKELHKHIVHRDLKPENILVGPGGRLVLADFGLAKFIDEKTRTHSFKGFGTIPYMAPECWTGDSNTIAMDIYSLGILFFEILTGKLPSAAGTETEWRDFHLFEPVPNLSKFRNGISIKYNQIVQKMTAKRTAQRYQTIDQVVIAINEAIKISTIETNEAERLARMGNVVLQNIKKKQLEAQKAAEAQKEWARKLNFHVTELFNRFVEKVDSVNALLEETKIGTQEKAPRHDITRELSVTFGRRGISITIGSHDMVLRQEERQRATFLETQRLRFGGSVFQPWTTGYFISNKIVLLGLAETNFKIGVIEYGYNLALKMDDNSGYGTWHLIQFSKNTTPPETAFGIDLSNFFKSFDELKTSPFHTTVFRELTDQDINDLLEKLMLQ